LGDFDYNGFVDDADVTLLGVFYDPSAPPLVVPASVMATNLAAVPEPSTLVLLITLSIVALFAMRYRRLTAAGASLTNDGHVERILQPAAALGPCFSDPFRRTRATSE
jgi:hypothetical protein